MTREDHDTDALIAALRSPALPAEQAGEAAAVTAMLEVLPAATATHAAAGLRSRRGIAIAAVTVASLGVGGLVAAGPGFFQPAADRPTLTDETPPPHVGDDAVSEVEPGVDTTSEDATGDDTASEVVQSPADTPAIEIECADGNHGKTVSSIANELRDAESKGQIVRQAAQSDCGKPGAGDDGAEGSLDGDIECADGNHGETVSSVAHETEPVEGEGKGAAVSEAARSDCGKPEGGAGTETAPGQNGERGNSDDAGKPADAGQPDQSPADTRPDAPDKPDTPDKPDAGKPDKDG